MGIINKMDYSFADSEDVGERGGIPWEDTGHLERY